MSSTELTPDFRIEVSAGGEANERLFYFESAADAPLSSGVAEFLARDRSFKSVSNVETAGPDGRIPTREGKNFIKISVAEGADWMAPPMYDKTKIESRVVPDKGALAIEALKFVLGAAHARRELED